MTTERKGQLALEQMKMAFDYTKWHIGLYAASIAVLVTGQDQIFPHAWMRVAAVGLLVASATCGAIIASSLLDAYNSYGMWKHEGIDFWNVKAGPFRWSWLKLKWWGFIEHLTFWMALLFVVTAVTLKNLG